RRRCGNGRMGCTDPIATTRGVPMAGQTGPRRRWSWLLRGPPVAAFLLLAAGLGGFDARYLLLREGMASSRVEALMGRPGYYDLYVDPLDDTEAPASFYDYGRTQVIVVWGPDGRVRKKVFLQSFR